jgi:hypothetical protein
MSYDVTDNDAPLIGPDDRSSAAATPQKRKITDFFKIVPSAEHIQHNDEMMAPDSMDLRNVFKSGHITNRGNMFHDDASDNHEGDIISDSDDVDLSRTSIGSDADNDADDIAHCNDDDADDDDGVDLLDLTDAVPPVPDPIVPVAINTPASKLRPYNSKFAAKCAHSGSEITSGTTGSDEPSDDGDKSNSFLNDEEVIMTRADKKRVKHFMKLYRGCRGKKKRQRQ